jgi:hypothetical protein
VSLAEAVTQVDDLVFADDKLVETTSQFWREIIVEEESQAARRVSNSIASRTSFFVFFNSWVLASNNALFFELLVCTRCVTI